MFARNVSLRLKPNTMSEFTRLFEKEVIPMLRKQSGFRDEIAFAVSGGLDVDVKKYAYEVFSTDSMTKLNHAQLTSIGEWLESLQ